MSADSNYEEPSEEEVLEADLLRLKRSYTSLENEYKLFKEETRRKLLKQRLNKLSPNLVVCKFRPYAQTYCWGCFKNCHERARLRVHLWLTYDVDMENNYYMYMYA